MTDDELQVTSVKVNAARWKQAKIKGVTEEMPLHELLDQGLQLRLLLDKDQFAATLKGLQKERKR